MSESVLLCDGQGLKKALLASTRWLENHVSIVNALNVFPVPDGDTGTNMVLTMQSTLKEMDRTEDNSIGALAHAASYGALMGARGNSGVILSQLFRGFAHSMEGQETFTAKDMAEAFEESARTAYKGVMKPVEGTILTVSNEMARAATKAATSTDDIRGVLDAALKRGKETLELTPELLPILKESGVVDAGGQGLVYILEGALRYLMGEPVEAKEGEAVAEMTVGMVQAHTHAVEGEAGYGYDVQFIIKNVEGQGGELDIVEIRNTIEAMGDSALVVGDEGAIKVHVHVPDPGIPISYGVQKGVLLDVVVENMDEQSREFSNRKEKAKSTEEVTEIATVCVAPGDGLKNVFESLGASRVVSGGQTMNPSTEEILQAVRDVKSRAVLVLPNNGNIIMAAEQAAKLADKETYVIHSRSIPQGIGALLHFSYQADAKTNVERMEKAMKDVQTIEMTWAVRATNINGLGVDEGDVIGLLNGKLTARGDDFGKVMLDILSGMGYDEYEVATIYYGEDVTEEDAETLAETMQELCEDLEIEVLAGGQPYYPYIVSLE